MDEQQNTGRRGKNKRLPPFSELPDSAFARRSQIIPTPIPISGVTFWRWVETGRFPAPEIIHGIKFWNVGKIREWQRTQIEEAAA